MKGMTAILTAGLLLAACRAPAPGRLGQAGSDCFSFETFNNVKVVTGGTGERPGHTSRPYRLDIRTIQRPCGKFKEIVWTNDIAVHINEKLGACQRREVLKHERKHVASYLKAFEEIPPWVASYMRSKGKNTPDKRLYKDIYGALIALQERITEESRELDWWEYKNPAVTHYLVRACGGVWGE